ncbi:hypothetical protein [Streptomyces sp. JV178]|uniref:hypothetical protein n=1 Tax=Streptomyces sp. JV178 TaxID=858632 RepID=UPI0015D549E9|nr:hypothetical protein [Streptomyces sp. JV178]
MTESETAAAVTREPSRFPAANATADVRTLAPGASAGTPAAEAPYALASHRAVVGASSR